MIIDSSPSHSAIVQSTFLDEYPNHQGTITISSGYQSGYDLVIKSDATLSSNQNNGSPTELWVMPLGSNASIQINNPSSFPQYVIATGATNDGINNNTAYGAALEFIDFDDMNDGIALSSFSNARIAAKLAKMKEGTNLSWSDIRTNARNNSSYFGSYTIQNGFGIIN